MVRLVHLSEEHVRKHLAEYIAVSADVSPWGEQQFLLHLPLKWELSFALWDERPIAYCIMSLKATSVHIHQFMVHRSARNAGIGRRMMSLAKEISRPKARRITLKTQNSNISARSFYLKHGFLIIAEEAEYCVLELYL